MAGRWSRARDGDMAGVVSQMGEMRNKVERSAERGILNQQPQAEKGTTQVNR